MYPQRCEHQRILGMVQLREPIVIVPFQASIAPPRSSHNVLSLRLMILSRPQSAHLQDHVDTCNANHVSHPRLYCGICRPLPKVSDRSSCNHSVDSCRSKQIGEGCLNLSSCVFPPPLPSPVKTKVQFTFSPSLLHHSPIMVVFPAFPSLSLLSLVLQIILPLEYSTSGP